MANLFKPSSYGLSLVPLFILGYVSVNSSTAPLFAFVSFLVLLLLHICISLHEAAPHDSPHRSRSSLRAAVLLLSTLLTVMFSYRVAEILPLPAAVVVWCTGAATVAFGFYLIFVHNNYKNDAAAAAAAAAAADANANADADADADADAAAAEKPTVMN